MQERVLQEPYFVPRVSRAYAAHKPNGRPTRQLKLFVTPALHYEYVSTCVSLFQSVEVGNFVNKKNILRWQYHLLFSRSSDIPINVFSYSDNCLILKPNKR